MLAQLFLAAIVGKDHLLALCIALEDHIGVQYTAELTQEVEGVVTQLLGGQQHHHHQCAGRQPLGHMLRAVQPIPLALGAVAALVTVPVAEVVLAVLVIQGVALAFCMLAVEAVKEAAGRVALAVAAAVTEVLPALQGL